MGKLRIIETRIELGAQPEAHLREYAINGMRKIRYFWTCTDYIYHEHRSKWVAWICGRWQRIWMPSHEVAKFSDG